MASDSFSVLIKTEKEASEIIKKAKDERKAIMAKAQRDLEVEIEQYKNNEEARIKSEQSQSDTVEDSKGDAEAKDSQAKIREIRENTKKNLPLMVETLVSIVIAV
ncbi:hypothetical protein DIPPA_02819 [Diplonema papillatum]|nr:hypothetical protein DIPPA_02819 [Diplonema papillatum]|eukprot:gene16646-25535_t